MGKSSGSPRHYDGFLRKGVQIMAAMDWARLLCDKRVRELMGGKSGTKDHRTEYQRDFDRVMFSSPVRRLQDKTQVFPLDPNDAVRTRLTHSLEVSAVARGIADRVCQMQGSSSAMFARRNDIEVIAATVGLVHDLGNPPFGHFGEDSIREWFKGEGAPQIAELRDYPQLQADFVKFEGNARTLRLLCSLQVLTDVFGLNLTAATVSAAMKYTASGDQVLKKTGGPAGQAGKKPGFCFAEKVVVEKIRDATGTGTARHPITYLVEAADDCVYSFCDLEDAVKKGVLSWEELKKELRDGLKAEPFAPFLPALEELFKAVEAKLEEAAPAGISLHGPTRDYACAQWLRILGATKVVDGASEAFAANYHQIMDGTFLTDLVGSPAAGFGGALVAAAKYAGQSRVYVTRKNIELELRGRTVLHDLLHLLSFGARTAAPDKLPKDCDGLERRAWSLLSESYRTVFGASWARLGEQARATNIPLEALQTYHRMLLLTDYVGGMTDTFACTLHQTLKNAC